MANVEKKTYNGDVVVVIFFNKECWQPMATSSFPLNPVVKDRISTAIDILRGQNLFGVWQKLECGGCNGFVIQWNLSKSNLLSANFCVQKTNVQFILVTVTQKSYIETKIFKA